jgi:putative chitinase
MITLEQLLKMNENKNKADCEFYINAFNSFLPQYQIDTPLQLSHFFAQIFHDSGNLHCKEEDLNYSAHKLRTKFSKYFPSDEIAKEYGEKPEKIANKIYGDQMGNGHEKSGDGWKYRGRGLIHIRGKDNYKLCGYGLKPELDLVNNPDLLCQTPENIVSYACWFWSYRSLNNLANMDDILAITKMITGELNGLEERRRKLSIIKRVLGC